MGYFAASAGSIWSEGFVRGAVLRGRRLGREQTKSPPGILGTFFGKGTARAGFKYRSNAAARSRSVNATAVLIRQGLYLEV